MVIYRQLNNALVCRPTLTNSRFRYYFGLAYFASLITKLMLEFSLLCRNLKLILADLHKNYFVFRMFFSLSFNSIDLHWGENQLVSCQNLCSKPMYIIECISYICNKICYNQTNNLLNSRFDTCTSQSLLLQLCRLFYLHKMVHLYVHTFMNINI